MRMQCRVNGHNNALAVFDVLAGQDRCVTVNYDTASRWASIGFDARPGEKDWQKHLQSMFPRVQLSLTVTEV